jgi:hypothetical protein
MRENTVICATPAGVREGTFESSDGGTFTSRTKDTGEGPVQHFTSFSEYLNFTNYFLHSQTSRLGMRYRDINIKIVYCNILTASVG